MLLTKNKYDDDHVRNHHYTAFITSRSELNNILFLNQSNFKVFIDIFIPVSIC